MFTITFDDTQWDHVDPITGYRYLWPKPPTTNTLTIVPDGWVEVGYTSDDPTVQCVTCGVRAVLVNGQPVNPGPENAPPSCPWHPNGRRRAHGPFIPIGDTP